VDGFYGECRMKLRIKVKPGARMEKFEEQADGSWLAWIKAPPVDGKANEELIRMVANHFDLPRSKITIRSGAGGRLKTVDVEDG
jgi:uncharacterized protein (TIGR00251 family)